jgi:hypothetical protein
LLDYKTTLEERTVIMRALLSKHLAVALAAGAVVLLASGCAWSIGDSKDAKTYVQPTRGQELSDLKKAKDQGALTDQEYEAEKNRILAK